MPRTRTPRRDRWSDAVQHLRKVGPYWSDVIERVGHCSLEPRTDRFGTLVRSIIGQQISSKAAASISGRVFAEAGEPLQPAAILGLGENRLRSFGVSRVKAGYLLGLSDAVAAGRLPFHEFDAWDDDAIIARLTEVKGIGTWTAEMFLIFVLNRPDVLPVHDLGVRAAIRKLHGLDELPKPTQCRALAEPWRPFRSIASWYIWRDADSKVAATK